MLRWKTMSASGTLVGWPTQLQRLSSAVLNAGDIIVSRAECSKIGGLGLYDAAELNKIERVMKVFAIEREPPNDVWIKHIPLVSGPNARSGLGAHLKKALARKNLNGFPQGISADAKFGRQLRLSWQSTIPCEVAPDDAEAKLLDRQLRQRSPPELANSVLTEGFHRGHLR